MPRLRPSSFVILGLSAFLRAQGFSQDPFEDASRWKALPSEGVALRLAGIPGVAGRALRLDLDFHGGAGYAALRRELPLQLPANYEFSFWMRGTCPSNTLEFKLVDASGENVWWVRRPAFEFRGAWTRVVFKKRHVAFAWGPLGGGEPRNLATLEIAITAGKGGKGTVDLDDLRLHALPPEGAAGAPLRARASDPGSAPEKALDGREDTAWRTARNEAWFLLDLGAHRTLGGLRLAWDDVDFPKDYAIEASEDGRRWETLLRVRDSGGGLRNHALPDAETRFLRLRCSRASRGPGIGRGMALREAAVEPLAFSATPNAFMQALAQASPRGDWPRGFLKEQAYWTLVGVDGGADTGLLGEDGALEPGSGRFSLEPFLWSEGRLLRWSDVEIRPSLANNCLPIPSVDWKAGSLGLKVTALGSGAPGTPLIHARYRVTNQGSSPWKGSLFLAVRPLQVNPPAQFLGVEGGVSPIRSMQFRNGAVEVNGVPSAFPDRPPEGFGARAFDSGNLLDDMRRGQLPPAASAEDSTGYASGALRFDLELEPGASRDLCVDLPVVPGSGLAPDRPAFEEALGDATRSWAAKLERTAFHIPDPAVADTLRTALAHLLLSRNGPALQPGTRAYRRSWIRDGALMGTVLLRLGHPEPVRAFLDWYAPRIFPSGKVPCVVDARGADPVPENDSHGEFLYLVAEYDRFQKDEALLQRLWPQVVKVKGYLDQLIGQRRTPDFEQGPKRLFYGLVPESISHEGYSAKPMHSYWDDFFTLRGLKDAAALAARAGRADLARAWSADADRFRADFLASLERSMAEHRIPYLPGCAELGDFDATSTTVGISPGGELERLPRKAVEATFDAFYRNVMARQIPQSQAPQSQVPQSREDRYTPYETRAIGSMVQLGWRERAHDLMDVYLKDRRPLPWNQWPEVVMLDPRAPVFLGDLPHAWVGSDFLRSVLSMFAFERETDQALVLGAGLRASWLRAPEGVGVEGLCLPGGRLNLKARAEGRRVTWEVGGDLKVPPGGLVLRWPLEGGFRQVRVNGVSVPVEPGAELVLRRLPATVEMEP